MDPPSHKTVVVFGSSEPAEGTAQFEQARELGQALGAAGYVIANGGYGGTMAASAQGAKRAHARTIGVTCTAFNRPGPNRWIDKQIPTADLSERLMRLINLGDAYVVLPGGTGTLLELAACWELTNKRFLNRKPIICLSNYWKPVIDAVCRSGHCDAGCFRFAETTSGVLHILAEHFRPA